MRGIDAGNQFRPKKQKSLASDGKQTSLLQQEGKPSIHSSTMFSLTVDSRCSLISCFHFASQVRPLGVGSAHSLRHRSHGQPAKKNANANCHIRTTTTYVSSSRCGRTNPTSTHTYHDNGVVHTYQVPRYALVKIIWCILSVFSNGP